LTERYTNSSTNYCIKEITMEELEAERKEASCLDIAKVDL